MVHVAPPTAHECQRTKKRQIYKLHIITTTLQRTKGGRKM